MAASGSSRFMFGAGAAARGDILQMQPGEKRDDLVQHADDEGHEAADQQQDAGQQAPAGNLAKRRPDGCGQQHGEGKNGARQPELPVAVGRVGPRPPALRLQAQGEQREGDAGNRRQALAPANRHCRIEEDAERPASISPSMARGNHQLGRAG
jgi:hypothetical protein